MRALLCASSASTAKAPQCIQRGLASRRTLETNLARRSGVALEIPQRLILEDVIWAEDRGPCSRRSSRLFIDEDVFDFGLFDETIDDTQTGGRPASLPLHYTVDAALDAGAYDFLEIIERPA